MESWGANAPREPGARRRKLAGYIKAANELRQSYQQSYGLGNRDGGYEDDDASMPGSFTDGTVVRRDDEEMLLFPSYAKWHRSRQHKRHEQPGTESDLRAGSMQGTEEYWKKEWERYEDDKAIVDIDIRGWVFAPQRGPMTRKNRILVSMARRLSGIPAPAGDREASPTSSIHARTEAKIMQKEDELAEREARRLEARGKSEANVAEQGGYSEAPGSAQIRQTASTSSAPSQGSMTLAEGSAHHSLNRVASNSSLRSLSKQKAFTQPADMTADELSVANSHLMVRLRPFLTTPLVSIQLTVFFYNDDTSKSRTITTDESGHFTYRAALDFLPTHVRVLASDKLSATEEIRITKRTGVSVISDIDDTIKHSAISSGAREIFRNAFIRELDQLCVDGVKEWYRTLADMGVEFHYVSNSPWQVYPVLTSFFAVAGLPKGSFHLKQYSGMLQGIFEPVAERKKTTLDKILADFPERRFILVGDSGEADLEVYTEIMLANPNRILAVFIRDVTTSPSRSFSDSSDRKTSLPPFPERPKPQMSSTTSSITSDLSDKRPALPTRPSARSAHSRFANPAPPASQSEKLIDIDDEPPVPRVNDKSALSTKTTSPATECLSSLQSSHPQKPSKPDALTLRSSSSLSSQSSSAASSQPSSIPRKSPPPRPPKPQQYSSATSSESKNTNNDATTVQRPSNVGKAATNPSNLSTSKPTHDPQSNESAGYTTAARNMVANAYNSLPSFYASNVQPSSLPSAAAARIAPKPPPPRRSANASTARIGLPSSNGRIDHPNDANTGAFSVARNGFGENGAYYDADGNEVYLSKKEELWLRRWDDARRVFQKKGVVLRSWREGKDVADECIRVVEQALKQDEQKAGKGDRPKDG